MALLLLDAVSGHSCEPTETHRAVLLTCFSDYLKFRKPKLTEIVSARAAGLSSTFVPSALLSEQVEALPRHYTHRPPARWKCMAVLLFRRLR